MHFVRYVFLKSENPSCLINTTLYNVRRVSSYNNFNPSKIMRGLEKIPADSFFARADSLLYEVDILLLTTSGHFVECIASSAWYGS